LHNGSTPRLERLLARPVVPIAGLAVLGIDLLAGKWTHELTSVYVVYCSIAAAAIIGHIMVAPHSVVSKAAALPAAVWIGKLSYSIYLWHNPIWVYFSTDRFDVSVVLLTLAEWAVTAVVVLVSYYGIEKPFMRFRKRFAH
ncbi:MAG: acyltransferase, partial [Actinobacteria bacterium]|nr:acyltransferase [Actinomycetota bacterium]